MTLALIIAIAALIGLAMLYVKAMQKQAVLDKENQDLGKNDDIREKQLEIAANPVPADPLQRMHDGEL